MSSFTSKLSKKSSSPFKWVRPKSNDDPPKKPLSSYNIYFLLERERIVQGMEEERIYTIDDVQNIVQIQKWNHNFRKRQHRKTHGMVSFHDLSRVVANNWRQLCDEHKAVFNHQAAIEKKIYKQALDVWVMKQMQGQSKHITSTNTVATTQEVTSTRDVIQSNTTPIIADRNNSSSRISSDKNNRIYEVYDMTLTGDDNKSLLSNEEVSYLLGCFNIVPPQNDDTPTISGSASLSSSSSTTTMINVGVADQINNSPYGYCDEQHSISSDWSVIDIDTPLWYENLTGCSEEFALQMIDSMHNDTNNQMLLDRAITF